jgi:hypothetical protein
MDDFLAPAPKTKKFNPLFLIGILVGLALVGAAIFAMSFRPTVEEQAQQVLAGTFKEGSPEFAELSRDIIISTSDETVQSPMGLGTVSMFIKGRVRNKGTRTITALEINVAVVDQYKEVLKEKRVLAIPVQRATLGPDETIPVTLQLDGFAPNDDRADIRWRVTAIKAD